MKRGRGKRRMANYISKKKKKKKASPIFINKKLFSLLYMSYIYFFFNNFNETKNFIIVDMFCSD